MLVDITNPFANTQAIPAQVYGTIPKLGTVIPQVTKPPYVNPAGVSKVFSANDKANIVSSLSYVVGGIANGQFLSLNNTQINAIQQIYAAWSATSPYGGTIPGLITIPTAALQNTAIALDAINYLQTTGLLTTQQDLLNSNGQSQMVTDYAPNGAITMTIHNQKVICEVPGQNIWAVSNVGNGASWNPLSVGVLETYSDQPIAVDQCYGYVLVFGQQSYEWWTDAGNVPMPYVILQGCAQNIGLAAVFSRAQFMGNIVFLGRFKTGQMHVMQTNGTGPPIVISTPDLDQIINNFPEGQFQDAVARTDDFNGHPVYIITFIKAKRTFLYDGFSKVWSEMQSGTAEYQRHMATLSATLNNGTIASDWESGNVYVVDPNNYTDNGYAIKREWVSKHVRNEGNIFSVTMLELVMQVGTGAQNTGSLVAPTTATPQIELFISTDGGNTWSQGEAAELGEVGQYTTRVYWRQLGTGRDFVFKFRMTDPVPFVIASGYATIKPGAPD